MPNIKYKFCFSDNEISELKGVLANSKSDSRIATRAHILLTLSESKERHLRTEDIARICNTTVTTVQTVRAKYSLEGLEATLYPPAPITPKTSGIEEKVIQLIQTSPPNGRKKWSAQMLADQCVALGYVDSISHTSIQRFLKKNNISLK